MLNAEKMSQILGGSEMFDFLLNIAQERLNEIDSGVEIEM